MVRGHCSTWKQWQLWLMNEGGYRGEDVGYGWHRATQSRDPCWLDLWHPTQPCVLPCHMQMCIPFRSVRNSYQVSSKLDFPGWVCVTQMVGILHGRWSVRFTSPCTASNRVQPLWHLWTGWPCRKRQTCFWWSKLQLIPPHPAARHTRSLLGQFQPFKPSLCPVNRW